MRRSFAAHWRKPRPIIRKTPPRGKLENFYLGQAATGRSETPEELAQAVSDMTAERICRAMETVRLDTVYFLKGKEAEA